MELFKETIRKLYRQTGRLNLYICLFCDKSEPDIGRLIGELELIKKLITEIEENIDCLSHK